MYHGMQLDIPAFDWPAVSWPAIQYPLDEFAAENAEAEARAIANVEETIKAQAKKGKKVAALIVEPVQSEGGDNHASPNFFKALRTVTRVSFVLVRSVACRRNWGRNEKRADHRATRSAGTWRSVCISHTATAHVRVVSRPAFLFKSTHSYKALKLTLFLPTCFARTRSLPDRG
jgi:hypothetical protein